MTTPQQWLEAVAKLLRVAVPPVPEPLTAATANAVIDEMLRSRDARTLDRETGGE